MQSRWDFFHRNTLRWRQLWKPLYAAMAIGVVIIIVLLNLPNPPSLAQSLEPVLIFAFVFIFGYSAVALIECSEDAG